MIDDSQKTALLQAIENYERAVRETLFAAERRAQGAIAVDAYQETVRKLDCARLHLKGVRSACSVKADPVRHPLTDTTT